MGSAAGGAAGSVAGGATASSIAAASAARQIAAVSGRGMTTVTPDDYADEDGWIMALGTPSEEQEQYDDEGYEARGWTLLLVDSGACVHVCPESFADHVPLETAPPMDLRAANGGALQQYGLRRVPVWARTESGRAVRLTIPFVVCDVKRPILSVGMLVD